MDSSVPLAPVMKEPLRSSPTEGARRKEVGQEPGEAWARTGFLL